MNGAAPIGAPHEYAITAEELELRTDGHFAPQLPATFRGSDIRPQRRKLSSIPINLYLR